MSHSDTQILHIAAADTPISGAAWLTQDDDFLGGYRDQVFFWMALVIAAVLLPFTINHLLQGRIIAGIALLLIMTILGVNAIAVRANRKPPVPPALVFLPIVGVFAVILPVQGINLLFWAYPVLLLFHFTLSPRNANLLSSLLTVLLTAMTYHYIGAETTMRLAATMLLTIIFANIFLFILASLQKRLQTLANVDALTGVFNRRYLDTLLGNAISLKQRHGTPASLIILDIDHFKNINDSFGHSAGDEALRKVAELIGRSCRQADTLCRLGGEEFAVLLPEADQASALHAAEKLRAAVAAASIIEAHPMTISAGVAAIGEHDTRDNLLKRCDSALYDAKRQGRNRVCAAA